MSALGYKYNVANIDPAPLSRKAHDRAQEIMDSFPPSEYLRLAHYAARLEAENAMLIDKLEKIKDDK